jgi:hypothetical protein
VLSIALGSESIRGGLLDANGTLHHSTKLKAVPGQLGQPPDKLFHRLRELAGNVMAAGLADSDSDADLRVNGALRMLGVNVAWPSPIDHHGYPRGRVLSDVGWHMAAPGETKRLSLGEHVARALGPPFSERIDRASAINDANADSLAVAFDHARDRALEPDEEDAPRVILTVRIGGGLGAATIELATHKRSELSSFISARLMMGTNGYAGELGHLPISKATVREITLDPPEGLATIDHQSVCSCGGHGHLESLAGGTAFALRMERSGYRVMDDDARASSHTRKLISDRGNIHAQRALLDCGRLLGRALANAILMHDPHSVWLTGFFADEQVVRGIELERAIWGSTIGDTVTIEHLKGESYADNAVRGAGLEVIRARVMRDLPSLLSRDSLERLTFPFEQVHLHRLCH